MLDFLLERFRSAEGETAFIHDDKSYSYRWLLDKIDFYKGIFKEKQIQPGEVVTVVSDYSPQTFCLLCALILNRNVVVPLTEDSVVEMEETLSLSECSKVIRFSDDFEKTFIEARDSAVNNVLLRDFLERGESGILLFSSGSTGKPKGILLDFSAMIKKFQVVQNRIRALSFLMFDHFGGINTVFHILSGLGTVITLPNRSVETICSAIEKHRVELLPATPSFLKMLVSSGALGRFDLGSLKLITYGTEVMSQNTLDLLRKKFPNVKLQQTYGLSELGVLRSKSRDDGSLWVKIGGEGFQTKVVDGVLWIKSDFAMVGYINAPNPFDEDGWFCTQDLVEVDGDYFRILGRTTDIINIGGQKVYPAEVESVVAQLENVKDVAVYGEENALLGQIVVAEIETEMPEPIAELKKRVRRICGEKLASYKVPSKIIASDRRMYSVRMKKIRSGKKMEKDV